MLISPKTNNQLNLIIQKMFYLNRVLDRAVSVLSVNFTCVRASKILHLNFSHKFPILADQISEVQDAFNVLTDYLDTPKDVSIYSNLLEMFQTVLDNIIEANDLIIEGIEIAQDESDINVKTYLEKFLSNTFINYINQAIILRDKAKLYGEDITGFDRDIHKFFILEEIGD